VVKGAIPDFSVAVGAPAKVVGSTKGKGAEVFDR
jgi:acetyltransferase-like isoleucine patch superfamily enzyme